MTGTARRLTRIWPHSSSAGRASRSGTILSGLPAFLQTACMVGFPILRDNDVSLADDLGGLYLRRLWGCCKASQRPEQSGRCMHAGAQQNPNMSNFTPVIAGLFHCLDRCLEIFTTSKADAHMQRHVAFMIPCLNVPEHLMKSKAGCCVSLRAFAIYAHNLHGCALR